MASESDRAKTNAAVGLMLCVVGGVVVRRSLVIGAALTVGGLICVYFAITGRRQ
jgi:hypothetical protein